MAKENGLSVLGLVGRLLFQPMKRKRNHDALQLSEGSGLWSIIIRSPDLAVA
jgi:hypothetical protein